MRRNAPVTKRSCSLTNEVRGFRAAKVARRCVVGLPERSESEGPEMGS